MVLDNMALLVNKNKTKQQTNITIASTFARILFFFLIKGLAGVSAGAITYCMYGLSDFEINEGISNNYVKVDGLGFTNYMFVPHFSSDEKKKEDLEKVLKENNDIKALCVDNCCAVKIIDDDISIIRSKDDAKAYEAFYDNKLEIKEF